MFHSHYQLYQTCFPGYPLSYEDFCDITDIANTPVLPEEKDGDKLIGYALGGNGHVTVLAVDKAYRNRGIGSRLLTQAEARLTENGADRIVLGRGSSMFQGAPIDADAQDIQSFFEKRGYRSEGVTYNMDIDTADFVYGTHGIPRPENVTYRFAAATDTDELLTAVERTDSGWTSLYRDCDDDILLAICDGRIVGFELLGEYGGIFTQNAHKHGSIGCVGVIPEYRRRGIGLDMTARAVQMLKDRGCDKIQLLYLVLDHWYGKLGFYKTSTQWMAHKSL
ncbi:MAG: GNAT family N-acetyltransferase [Ruminococcaceae bacterium]|nr:GNAT family N-acetyltransferase [Oscillospiraceae bacterium]